MGSAYYSRNNSYSRSYNAQVAESSGRYPRTRAARNMGLSVKLFDLGCKAIGYTPTEWHHVGKYANEVVYYDTTAIDNYAFWLAIVKITRGTRKQWAKQRLNEYLRDAARDRLQERLTPDTRVTDRYRFEQSLRNRCEQFNIPYAAMFRALKDTRGNRGDRIISLEGQYKWVTPFDLTRVNMRRKLAELHNTPEANWRKYIATGRIMIVDRTFVRAMLGSGEKNLDYQLSCITIVEGAEWMTKQLAWKFIKEIYNRRKIRNEKSICSNQD